MLFRSYLCLALFVSFVFYADSAPVLSSDENIAFIYYCKPIHYLSTKVQWQRIDSGVYISSNTAPIAYIDIWIDDFDANSDSIAMLGNDCKQYSFKHTNIYIYIYTQIHSCIRTRIQPHSIHICTYLFLNLENDKLLKNLTTYFE